MVNPHFEPTEDEEAVLDVMAEEYRANPYLIRERTGLGKGDVNTALTRLTSAGWVLKVTRGLYEFVDDPRGEQGNEETQDEQPEPEPADERATADAASGGSVQNTDDLRDQLRGELAGSGDLLEQRVDAILTMYDVLRERGEAEKGDLLDAVDVDATGYASADSVWSNAVKGNQTLSALPGVSTPPTGRTVWRYTDA